MQEIVISFSQKQLNEKTDKALMRKEICKTLTTGSSPIRYGSGKLYIPQLLGSYKVVNKELLLSPINEYVECLQKTLHEQDGYIAVAATAQQQIIDMLLFLGGTQNSGCGSEVQETEIQKSDTELFSNKEYLFSKLLPTLYPFIYRRHLDECIQIQVTQKGTIHKKTVFPNDLFLYILGKYKKDVHTLYSLGEQIEIVCIYLSHLLKKKIQVVGPITDQTYVNLKKYVLTHTHNENQTKKDLSQRRTFQKKKQKSIFHEGKDNDRLFTINLIEELGYEGHIYKDIKELLHVEEGKTVLEVAVAFLNISESDFFLYQRDKKKKIIMRLCSKLFQEYQTYNSTSYARRFIK